MTKIVSLEQILKALPDIDVVAEIERGFVALSEGKVEVPPVGELLFPDESGELHIKYGAVRGDDVFVVKLATGFFNNPKLGLPPFSGCMLVLSAKTGQVLCILLEEGELTNHRTAAAGAVVARHLAPARLETIGICGAGVQARLQADYLRRVTQCRDLVLWARDVERATEAVRDIARMGYSARVAASPEEVASSSQLIVTTTAAHQPYLFAGSIRPGTHITAMGSDTPEKNEIDPMILKSAALVVADSIPQCLVRGEIHAAIAAGVLRREDVVELGNVISGKAGRRSPEDITVADLTGVAVQDIMIAKAVVARTT
ncbi:ornithine cyclodeaminase family protein [Mesorhizobium sp. M7A.F.Ca.US.006.04.2.1]|uniref:ornithine cyclodeaminase family protein n=2 Tax=Mesorhizobium TaxID=68287 RepID=UPI000FC9F49D|nr:MULTISPECIES: ornithine cyclodeaminase family protein [unclassified Mesorhizobium]RUX76927.1 ornithine cyclodeaminase family protein [Mesorhizobium sp. M7A.F.Ca.US.005.03.1.1]RUY26052.1 ornithine cyclodeaminase family protein [Mesorhizobium sp. M7A.F.Ca.US.001.04.2.1]RUY39178.1 ornithine cyclodeaminase family protein [Mesorhizobium sp. M7A.F.Ca.US.001.04.1.1]RVA90424.1 ornithine cyclodeaminase family protein [Mesorhizobium sp. M7A.F.Ca.US.006.04.2.1]